jgi:hypothetical protein
MPTVNGIFWLSGARSGAYGSSCEPEALAPVLPLELGWSLSAKAFRANEKLTNSNMVAKQGQGLGTPVLRHEGLAADRRFVIEPYPVADAQAIGFTA